MVQWAGPLRIAMPYTHHAAVEYLAAICDFQNLNQVVIAGAGIDKKTAGRAFSRIYNAMMYKVLHDFSQKVMRHGKVFRYLLQADAFAILAMQGDISNGAQGISESF